MPNTVRLHRVRAMLPEKIYRAFLEADALSEMAAAKWLYMHRGKVGCDGQGQFRISFRNFTTGHSHPFGGEYLELRPSERLRYTARSMTQIFRVKSCGTELNIVQEGLPDVIPVEALRNLARLVQPEIASSRQCPSTG